MKVLLDLNIWIDITLRYREFPQSLALFEDLKKQQHEIVFPSSSITTYIYLLNKFTSSKNKYATESLNLFVLQGVDFPNFGLKEMVKAIDIGLTDLEDSCIASIAFFNLCDFIATRNIADFKSSPVRAILPIDLLKKF